MMLIRFTGFVLPIAGILIRNTDLEYTRATILPKAIILTSWPFSQGQYLIDVVYKMTWKQEFLVMVCISHYSFQGLMATWPIT